MKPLFTIKHVAKRKDGCLGVFLHHNDDAEPDGQPFCNTIERTYDGPNGQQIVKLTPGIYRCTKDRYNKGGYDTYLIHVAGHDDIKIHKANFEVDVDGCVGTGEMLVVMGGKTAVANSKDAFAEFMQRAGGVDEFYLEVVDAC